MMKHITDILTDVDKIKVNIKMKDGTEYLGHDLIDRDTTDFISFEFEGGIRTVPSMDIVFYDLYMDESED